MHEVEALERATLAALPPQALEEARGWLLPFDGGTVGRVYSAAPLRHDKDTAAAGHEIADRYRERGHAAVLRLPDVAAFEALQSELARGGLQPARPTLVQTAALAGLQAVPAARVQLRQEPCAAWAGVFLGSGFDPVDGASRVAIFSRGRETVFATMEVEGEVVAAGVGCMAHGWCGIHGMRTAESQRGRGHAQAVLSALAQEARRRGLARAFLQVDEANAAALSLYRRAGFTTAWRYRYWR